MLCSDRQATGFQHQQPLEGNTSLPHANAAREQLFQRYSWHVDLHER